MGTGWRRAFCSRDPESTISDKEHHHQNHSPSPSPRSCVRLGFLSGASTPRSQSHTPTLRCRTISEAAAEANNTNTNTPKSTKSVSSNPSSPRSPLKLSLFKNSFKFRSSCGICLSSVKSGHGTAIYTAECSHAFHFPCIASHARKHQSLVCPVCNAVWKDVPLLSLRTNLPNDVVAEKPNNNAVTTVTVNKKTEESSPVFRYRSYNDDEPLLSPTSGGKIIPIPEADEGDNVNGDDDEDVEEFQGFFTNPKSSSSVKSYSDDFQLNEKDKESRNVQVKLTPECAVISVTRTHETYALVLRVKAPPARINTTSQRAPIDLVTVLDVGGSMNGGKLHMLKRAMRLVISSLGEADRLSIVAFSASPKRLLPLKTMTPQGQRSARRIVDRLVPAQGNCVGDALRKATKVLEDRRERNPVASVMLLSDGQDESVQTSNTANQRKSSGHVSSTRFAHIEIPVHAFGFGKKSGFSQDPAEDAFAKCVGGLLSVVVQDLRIQLGFQNGSSSSAEIAGLYLCSGRPTALGSGSIRLGDLYAEEEREILIELRVPTSLMSHRHVMTARCLYKDSASQEIVSSIEQPLLVPPAQGNHRSERLRNLFLTTRAIAESRRLVECNDLTSAHHLLASARALLIQAKSSSAEAYVRALEAELAEIHWRRQNPNPKSDPIVLPRRRGNEREPMVTVDENGEPLTPTSAWRAAEKLAKVAIMKKSLNRVSDLHGFENARF